MRLTNLAYLFGFAALVSFGCGGSSDGTPAATGGTPAATGGTPAATGGTPAATGGTPAATGGTPAATGGAGGTTTKPGCPAMPSCVNTAMANCAPSGACTSSGDMLTTPMTMCYANGVKMGVGLDMATMSMTMTLKKGSTVCMTGSGPISMTGPTTITFKDGSGKTLFTAKSTTAADGTSGPTTYTCPDGTSATVTAACDDMGTGSTDSTTCTQSADCKM